MTTTAFPTFSMSLYKLWSLSIAGRKASMLKFCVLLVLSYQQQQKKTDFYQPFVSLELFFSPSTLAANFIQIPFNVVKASAYLLHIKLSSIPPQYQSHHNFNSYYKKSYMTPAKRQTITSSAAGENGTPHFLALVQYTKIVQGFDRTHQSW